jgi:hypothetical protein
MGEELFIAFCKAIKAGMDSATALSQKRLDFKNFL